MESVYFVVTWLCHRNCVDCDEERFHPYYGDEQKHLAEEATRNVPMIIDNLPGTMILAGGEVLLGPTRQLHSKYKDAGGVGLIVQTTGDLVTERIVEELLEHHVNLISISGMDSVHKGFEEAEARDKLKAKLTPKTNITSTSSARRKMNRQDLAAQPSSEGCMKTKTPIGNLLERPLEEVLNSLNDNPIYEAISMGHPERMGLTHGWSVEKFIEKSMMRLPSGRLYPNLRVGYDRFHEEVLMAGDLVQIG